MDDFIADAGKNGLTEQNKKALEAAYNQYIDDMIAKAKQGEAAKAAGQVGNTDGKAGEAKKNEAAQNNGGDGNVENNNNEGDGNVDDGEGTENAGENQGAEANNNAGENNAVNKADIPALIDGLTADEQSKLLQLMTKKDDG